MQTHESWWPSDAAFVAESNAPTLKSIRPLEVAQNLEKLEYFPYLPSSLLAKKRQNLKNGITAIING
jgi:hypothetical protein